MYETMLEFFFSSKMPLIVSSSLTGSSALESTGKVIFDCLFTNNFSPPCTVNQLHLRNLMSPSFLQQPDFGKMETSFPFIWFRDEQKPDQHNRFLLGKTNHLATLCICLMR